MFLTGLNTFHRSASVFASASLSSFKLGLKNSGSFSHTLLLKYIHISTMTISTIFLILVFNINNPLYSGIVIIISVPLSISLFTVIVQFWASAICLAIESPRPVPPKPLALALSTR